MFSWINNFGLAVVVLIFMSWVVSKASDKLGDVLHVLGIKLRIPTSVRGATFDAISSSFPEFTTAMIAVLIYKRFADVGVPTIAGSGIFNILLIPMASIFAFKGKDLLLKVEKKVIYRDMIFYTIAIGALALFTYLGKYTPFTGVVLVVIYVFYISVLYRNTQSYRRELTQNEISKEKRELEEFLEEEEEEDVEVDMGYGAIVLWIAISIFFIWISIDAIIQSAIVISSTLNIPQYVVSVIIIAACTSIPDTLLSVKSSRMGDAEGAISNAVGSNIFDICVCLGLPMIIAGKTIPANFGQNIGSFIFLIVSMFTTALLLLKEKGVTKKDAYIMLGIYILFLGYVIGVALNLFA
ncbi:cation:H+ antiporter [Caminicella sporogenes DSM 14501]|uniref:Cation:H+ antiporter n=1 Tax=Caminicella sporogenes DSM 14501 TaxID=1121266 RepID=A0A1M6QKI4_9FIRM|nr:sodium:proton exchanger [Caminicella sporogenes]RKD25280.1 sodium:proton exchanger [Caminicella sporogenes]SHK20736.1 cation:H+ antiporter [Caminicella sporogenes DSM 14501]